MLTIADNPMGGFFIANFAKNQRTALDELRRLANEAGVAAFLVGGPVRDSLLGVPVNDLDISVVGDAPALAQSLANATGGRLTVHPRFGTASVAAAGCTVDLVTARRETYPKPAALPVVTAGSLADDLARRDFTINAMAVPLAAALEQVVDPHGGRADLDAGIIRALHRESFRDDPTRIFRAVRYEQRFAFRLSDDTRCDLESAVAAGAIAMLSGDRLRHELDRILHETSPLPALQRAEALGVLTATHPALGASHLDGLHDWTARPLAWLAALVWPLHDSTGSSVAARLNTPSDWTRVISDTATLTERLPDLAAEQVSAIGRVRAAGRFVARRAGGGNGAGPRAGIGTNQDVSGGMVDGCAPAARPRPAGSGSATGPGGRRGVACPATGASGWRNAQPQR